MSKETVAENLKSLNSPAPAAVGTVAGTDALRTPEAQAQANALVTEAVKAVFAQLAPMLQSMALTPEKIAEAEKMRRAPDPATVARELRERKMMQQDLAEAEALKRETQSNCPHAYPSGQSAFHVIHNYPDRQPRFSCPICSVFVTPKEWRIAAPDADNPRGRAFIAEAHPLYAEAFKSVAAKGSV